MPIVQPERLNTARAQAGFARWRAELLIVAAYGLILPPPFIEPPLIALNVHGDRVRHLDVRANDLLLRALRATGAVSVVASEELATPVVWSLPGAGESLAVCLDPVDGSLNTDVAGVLGLHGGKLSAAARHADMDNKNLWEKMVRYGLRSRAAAGEPPPEAAS